MNDAEWLDRVWRAYQVYQVRFPMGDLDDFIKWLYREYGILTPTQRKTHERSS